MKFRRPGLGYYSTFDDMKVAMSPEPPKSSVAGIASAFNRDGAKSIGNLNAAIQNNSIPAPIEPLPPVPDLKPTSFSEKSPIAPSASFDENRNGPVIITNLLRSMGGSMTPLTPPKSTP
jgi:hypothetical protein